MSVITQAWRTGRASARERRQTATLDALLRLLAVLAGRVARLPLAAIGAAGCFVAAGWHYGITAGLISTGVALLFLEWRVSR